MELSTLIVLGSFFVILLIAVGMVMIMLAHRNRTKAELDLQKVESQKQKEIAENTLVTQERERQQLGLELHDDLGPSFSAVRLMLGQVEQHLENGDNTIALEQIELAKTSLIESIQKFSNVSRILYPAALHRNGLQKAIEDIVNQCNNALGREVICLNYKLDHIEEEFMELTIYRICQELLNNGVKHSEADEIKLDLTSNDDSIYVNYIDSGKGFDLVSQASGLGLGSLKGRCEALGGALHFKSNPGQGTSATLLIPKKNRRK